MTFAVSPTLGRSLDALALLAVLLAAIAMALGLPPKPLPADSFLMVDYGLNTRQAVTIQGMAAGGGPMTWPEHYAYPPAYVVLMLGWLKLGSLAFPAWIALAIAALLGPVDRRAGHGDRDAARWHCGRGAVRAGRVLRRRLGPEVAQRQPGLSAGHHAGVVDRGTPPGAGGAAPL